MDPKLNKGSGWNSVLNLFNGGGDYNNDGNADIIGRKSADNSLVLYRGNGLGGFPQTTPLGTGWGVFTKLI